ncbi:MAG: MinD/ParA family protein [Fibrobacter sp.]|mgnify:CR=1 FL=1|nr:MinD/ParA family protein [Fibrobacter sp.]
MRDQAQKLRELAMERGVESVYHQPDKLSGSCKSIAVTSGKGGVGKTNVALFTAVFVAAFRKKVLLLDADLGLANVHIMLGMVPDKNISHYIDGQCSLDKILYRGPGGIDIIPGASGFEKLANIDLGRLGMLQNEFMKLESNYDFIIIDTGAGIGNNVIQFASRTDLSLIVMTPEPTSLADAYAMVKVLYDKGCPKIAVVVNMCASEREGNETFDRLNALVVKFLKRPLELFGTLPLDRDVSQCVKKQKLMVLDKGHESFNKKVLDIARKISGVQVIEKRGFFARFWNKEPKGLIE